MMARATAWEVEGGSPHRSDVTMEAERGGNTLCCWLWRQRKEKPRNEPLLAGKGKEIDSFLPRPPGVAWQTPKHKPNETDLGFLVSKTVGEYFSIIVSQQGCGNFLQQPQQTNIYLIHVSLKAISLPISVHSEENGYFNHSQMHVYSYSICTYYASIYIYTYIIYIWYI